MPELERARELQSGIETDPALVGDTLFALAQARWTLGDREAADEAASEAIAVFETVAAADKVAAVRQWRSER